MKTTTITYLLALLGLTMLSSCDPSHYGTSHIYNNSPYELTLSYSAFSPKTDTTILIPPNAYIAVFKFGGLGSGNNYSCCPCEFDTITLQPTDTTKSLIKPIDIKSNWALANPNEKRFDYEDISCVFTVTSSDIQ